MFELELAYADGFEAGRFGSAETQIVALNASYLYEEINRLA